MGCEPLGVRFEKWKVPLDAECEMYEALAITSVLNGDTILLKKQFALALADAILAAFPR